MLDSNTLKQLTDLTANTLYSAEVIRLPKLSRDEEAILIEHAREGDNEAREALIISCLSYAFHKACFVYYARRPQHDDLLDLAQQASVEMVEKLDKALEKSDPAGYLRGIAKNEISQYCTYHSDLIQKPEYALDLVEKRKAYTSVESLDMPLYRNGKSIQVELIEAPALQLEPDETDPQKHYTILYKAFHELSERHQGLLVRLYGLFGHPMETADEIGDFNLVHANAYNARKKLRAHITKYTQQASSNVADTEK
jgi:DNA-directed RNA polymerase specialized sigma24 family protein